MDTTKIQMKDGGDTMNVDTGGKMTANGVQPSAIADAKVDYTTGNLDTEAETIAALNATNGKINDILAVLRGLGQIASA